MDVNLSSRETAVALSTRKRQQPTDFQMHTERAGSYRDAALRSAGQSDCGRLNPELACPPDGVARRDRSRMHHQPTLTEVETELLNGLTEHHHAAQRTTLGHYLAMIASLGRDHARINDPQPGMTITWCGVSRRTDITQALGSLFVQSSPARSSFRCFQKDIDPTAWQRCTAARNFAWLAVNARPIGCAAADRKI